MHRRNTRPALQSRDRCYRGDQPHVAAAADIAPGSGAGRKEKRPEARKLPGADLTIFALDRTMAASLLQGKDLHDLTRFATTIEKAALR